MEFIDMSCCGSDYLSGDIQEKMDVEGGLLIRSTNALTEYNKFPVRRLNICGRNRE